MSVADSASQFLRAYRPSALLWHDGLGLSLYAKRLDRESSSGRRRRWSKDGEGGRRFDLGRTMIPMPSGVRVWIAAGHTDMRRGMQDLALQVQEQLKRDPHGGDLYLFRGRRGDLAKILKASPKVTPFAMTQLPSKAAAPKSHHELSRSGIFSGDHFTPLRGSSGILPARPNVFSALGPRLVPGSFSSALGPYATAGGKNIWLIMLYALPLPKQRR